jgi:hypothetical protein
LGENIKKNVVGGSCSTYGRENERERGSVNSVLVGNPEKKRPLGRSGHRWEDNIKMDFTK